MSKNLTRKGLALGAVVALGSSLFAGTPATAAPTAITFASAYGTSTTGILGEYFHLSALETGGADGDALKFYIEGATAANIDARVRKTTDLSSTSASGDQYSNETTNIVATDNVAKKATLLAPSGYTAGKYVEIALKLGSAVTATTSITVTPFIDSQLADGKPGTGELTGSPITINFVKASELTATPTVKAVTVGSAVAATVALSGGVNLEQFRAVAKGAFAASSAIKVKFADNGAVQSTNDGATGVAAVWNTTDSEFVATSLDLTAAAASHVYGATAFINTVESAAATAVTAGAGEVTGLDQIAVSGANYHAASFKGTANVIRSGAGSITLGSAVNAVSTGKFKAGQKVTFKILENGNNTLSGTITAGGKTLTNSSTTTQQSITVEVTSAADGSVELPVSYTGLAAADAVDVSAYTTPASGGSLVAAGTAVTLTAQDSVAYKLVDVIQSSHADSVRSVVKGAAASIALQVVDQFGQVPTGTFRVAVAYTTTAGTDVAPAIVTPVAVSGGKATVSITDNSSDAHTYSITTTLSKLGADGVTYQSSTTAGFAANLIATSKFAAGSAATVGAISLSADVTTSVSRATKTLVAGNEDLESGTVDHNAPTLGATLTTSVTSTTGAALPGAPVTFSAPGVLFKSGTSWGLGSLTVNAKATGALPDVLVYSNAVGTVTISAVSGGITKTVALKFAGPVDGGTAWTVTAPSSILPGQTLKISAILKDKFGAVVNTAAAKVKVSYTGPGYVTSTIADETDADGNVSFTVLLGAADAGTATVKFTYAGVNGTLEETVSNDDLVATASTVIGAAAVPAAATKANVVAKTKAFSVSVSGNASAKNVVVKVAGKTVATLAGSASAKTYTVKATKGSKKVTVYVGGKLLLTKTVSVK
jgi:hypothetical protein